MDNIAGISTDDIVRALRESVVSSNLRIKELETQRLNLRETYQRKDTELKEQIRDIETKTKTARDALKALAPPKDPEDMRIEVEAAVYQVLLDANSTDDPEMAVSRLLPQLSDLSWEYEGRGFENRVRNALKELQARDLVKSRKVETKNGAEANLWSVKNKRRKYRANEAS